MLRYIWTAHESQDLNRFLVDGTSRGRCTNQIVEDFPASFLNGNAMMCSIMLVILFFESPSDAITASHISSYIFATPSDVALLISDNNFRNLAQMTHKICSSLIMLSSVSISQFLSFFLEFLTSLTMQSSKNVSMISPTTSLIAF